jgi:hypothetical protein
MKKPPPPRRRINRMMMMMVVVDIDLRGLVRGVRATAWCGRNGETAKRGVRFLPSNTIGAGSGSEASGG